jgi:antitoxin VapB
MTLTINDAETDRLARQLAQLTGETITEAVARSVRERLAREKRRHGQRIDKQAVMTIVRRIEALPALDDRSADDILGYDEQGLPT